MPLLNKEAYEPRKEPSAKELLSSADRECWQIRCTGEICLSYDDYLEKLAVYQKRQWTCAVTGKADLTYEEAVESERKSKEYISRLAYPVQKRVLELAQFSTVSRMEHLVDEIVNELKDKYLVDEQVQLVNTGRDRNHPQVVIEQVLPDNQYRIVDIQTGDTQTVSASALGRTRNAISKQLVRAFLKEAIGRQSYVGAPWIVKDEYVSEFDINTTPPTELWDSKEKRLKRQAGGDDDHTKKKVKTGPPAELTKPKWPIEDTEIAIYIKPTQHPEMATSAVPKPRCDFATPKQSMGKLITVWTFLYIYSKPLKLYPFTIDDFETSLFHSSLPLPPILDHVHYALLRIATRRHNQWKTRQEKLAKTLPKHKLVSLQKKRQTRSLVDLESQNVNDIETSILEEEEDTNEEQSEALPERLVVKDSWWSMKVSLQNWTDVLMPFLVSEATGFHMPNLAPILTKLTGQSISIDPHSGKPLVSGAIQHDDIEEGAVCYGHLSIDEKLEILAFLIENHVMEEDEFRTFVENTLADFSEVRREKRELETKRRELTVAQKEISKKSDQESVSNGRSGNGSQEPEANGAIDVGTDDEHSNAGDEEQEDSDEEDESETEFDKTIRNLEAKLRELEDGGSRQEKLKIQQQLRDAEDAKREAQLEAAREQARKKNADTRARTEEKRQLDADMDEIHRQDYQLDRNFRIHGGIIRMRPLGYDRFWNRYWWFDGYGTGLTSVQENGNTPRGPHGSIPYASGRLWVEGSGHQDFLGFVSGASKMMASKRKISDEVHIPGWKPDAFVTLPFGYSTLKPGDAAGQNWLEDGEWACYDQPDQLDELLVWLNPKGVREQQLRNALQKYYDLITFNLRKRQEVAEHQMHYEDIKTRASTRSKSSGGSKEPHMQYSNKWAAK